MSEIRETAGRYLTSPVVRFTSAIRLSPNILTIGGFLLSLVAAIFIANGYFILAGVFILAAGFFDILDGAVARSSGKVTAFGAALDSTLDRYAEAALLLAFLWFYLLQGASGMVVLANVALVGALLVSYVRARAEGLRLKGESGFFTRTERIIALALGLFLNQMVIVLWLMAILTHFTVVQRLTSIWKQSKKP